MHMRRLFLPVLTSLFPLAHLSAATITSSASGDWGVGGNWIGGVSPNIGTSTGGPGVDNAIVDGHVMTVTTYPPGGDWAIRGNHFVTIQNGGVINENRGGVWVRIGDSENGTLNIHSGTFSKTGSNFRVGGGGGVGFVNIGDGVGTNDAVLNVNNVDNQYGGTMSRPSGGHAVVVINSDGLLTSNGANHYWGDNGNGTALLTINGGTYNKSSGGINLGQNPGSTGTFNIQNGGRLVHAGGLVVGNTGNGHMVMTSGTVQKANGDFILGNGAGGFGRLVMSNNTVWTHSGNDIRIGQQGAGEVSMSGNAQFTHTPSNWFQMGQSATGAGTMTLSDNAVFSTNGDSVRIGFAGTGVLTLNDNSQFISTHPGTSYPDGNTTLGRNAGSSGTVTVNGTSAFTSIQSIAVGEAGNGFVTVNGGLFRSNDAITIGRGQGGAAQGTVVLNNGIVQSNLLTLGEGVGGTASQGTVQQNGGTVIVGLATDGLRMSYSGSGRGTYNLEAGTLRLRHANLQFQTTGNGTFNWGGGTIAGYQPGLLDGTQGGTVHNNPPFTGSEVRTGDVITFTGNLASGYNGGASRVDLGTLYLNGGSVLHDALNVTGTLDLSAPGDELDLSQGTPYLLRPFGFFTEDYGSIPLVTAGTFTGTFDTLLAPIGDSRPWSLAGAPIIGGAVLDASTLAMNTYQFQYTNNQLFFHYRVSGAVPEPGSFALMSLGAYVLRFARRRR
jgi:T5SS/PEP-CTERM-associated repeat protein